MRKPVSSSIEVKSAEFAPSAADLRDEDALADAIERDGRALAAAGAVVTLGRYTGAVADLAARPVALDAAIDVVIRASTAAGLGLDEAIGRVVTAHPELARAVRECVQLNALLPTTPPAADPLAGGGTGATAHPGPSPGEGLGPLEADGQPRYRVSSEMGSGSFGRVVRAVDRRLGDTDAPAEVAVKVLTGAGVDDGRVLDEAVKARRVDHPNIVRVIDCGRDAAHGPYIVYELVEGGDLSRRLSEGKGALPVREAVGLVAAVARGIHAAHSAGLIHMDLKPANILLTPAGVPKVADFGNALRQARGGDAGGAGSGEGRNVRGNIAYLAPEQLRDPSAASTAVDVYALGGILLTALVGDVPLGYGLDPAARGEVEGRLAMFPGDLARVVARAMAPQARDRHESAAALAEDLERWLARLPIAWQRPGLVRRTALWTRRRPGVAVLLALLVAAVGVGAGVGWHFYVQALTNRLQNQSMRDAQKLLKALAGTFLETMPESRTMEIESSLLSQTMVTDWLFGPRMLFDTTQLAQSWDRRMKVSKELLEELRANGHEGDFRTLVWQTTYGFWCLLDGTPEEAGRELSDNRRRWAERLRPGDPLLTRLDELLLCVRCREAWGRSAKPGADATRDAELREVAGALRGSAERYFAELGKGQLHLAMLWTLRDAYGRYGLGDKAGASWVSKELAGKYPGMDESRPPRRPPGVGPEEKGLFKSWLGR